MKKVGVILIVLIIPLITAADQQGTIVVDVVGESDCSINLKQGWNLFSFCANLDDNNLQTVLLALQDRYRYVMGWDLTEQSFDIYSPRASQNPFTTFNDDKSYFIYMYEDATLIIHGTEAPIEQRNLIEGWDTPSYQYRFSTTITDIFQDVLINFRYLMKWDNVNQEFQIYSKRSSDNPFSQINPTEGRFVYMEAPSTIHY